MRNPLELRYPERHLVFDSEGREVGESFESVHLRSLVPHPVYHDADLCSGYKHFGSAQLPVTASVRAPVNNYLYYVHVLDY